MNEQFYIGAYWGNRREARTECAERLETMLRGLAGCHEIMTRWYRIASSKRAALRHPIALTRAALEPLLKVVCPPLGSSLGYAFSSWNGKDPPEAMGLTVTVGAWNPHASVNSVVLELPQVSPETETFFDAAVLVRAVEIIARAWDPEWALVINHEFRKRTQPPGPGNIGWITYLSSDRMQQVSGMPPCEMIPIDGGAIFVLTRDHPVSADNPEDVAMYEALAAWLGLAGARDLAAG
jgi:hypothetical protein